jgi:uncharacterized protein (TIGR01777 family)
MKIALTGSSGFVGTALQNRFGGLVSINREDNEEQIVQKLQDVDVVINLAGAPIIKRWSEPYKKVLVQSRIETTQKLVRALNKSSIKHFISTSAIGIYPSDIRCDEETEELSYDFLGLLSRAWESEANKCQKPTTIIRFGVILGKDGGALGQMITPFKLGVGGKIGNGKMITSWIHMDDLMGIYQHIIDNQLTGIYNATAPNPVSNHVFTKALGKALHRPTILPIPIFALKIMYGEAASVLTDSKEVFPTKIMASGYQFRFEHVGQALEDLLQN